MRSRRWTSLLVLLAIVAAIVVAGGHVSGARAFGRPGLLRLVEAVEAGDEFHEAYQRIERSSTAVMPESWERSILRPEQIGPEERGLASQQCDLDSKFLAVSASR